MDSFHSTNFVALPFTTKEFGDFLQKKLCLWKAHERENKAFFNTMRIYSNGAKKLIIIIIITT